MSESVRKVWNDANNQDGLRPSSVTVNLLANGQVVRTVELSAANNWQATINGLAANANGRAIDYSWVEANVPAGYASTVNGNVITNSHQPGFVSESVQKVWNDANNQDGLRPASVTVELLANGQVVRTVTLSAANNWQATINGLAANANGHAISYTWQEANVPAGYTSTVDGNVITNSHQPSLVSESVRKVWNDENNQDGLRPSSVTVNLLANGEAIQAVILNAANDWQATVNGLPANANGRAINYTWQETNVPAGYTSTVDGDVVTNTHTPKPTTPTTPDKPHQPTTPTTPMTPIVPNNPSPQEPPVEPNTPPTTPTTPTTPEQPTQPNLPGPKTTPVEPNVPTTPTTPVKPVQPNRPQPQGKTVPVSKPEAPVVPQKFAKPSEQTLPQTGNQNDGFALIALGLLMVFVSSAMIDLRKE